MYSIDFQIEATNAQVPVERMTAAIGDTLDGHEISPDTALTVVVSTDEHIQALNWQFRGVDAPTDVLSFLADVPPAPPDPADAEPPYLGDLIIAYPYTARQAAELGHSLDDELVLMVIHGTLHLLGYDHDSPDAQDEMWAEQAELLARANVAITVPRFTFGDTLASGDAANSAERQKDDSHAATP